MFFHLEQRDIHSAVLECDRKKANFLFLSIDCTLEWTSEYRIMKKKYIERRPLNRIEEEEKKTIEGNTSGRGQNTEQQYMMK